jgi:hypothetical protein
MSRHVYNDLSWSGSRNHGVRVFLVTVMSLLCGGLAGGVSVYALTSIRGASLSPPSPRPHVLIGAPAPPEPLSTARQDVATQDVGAETERYSPPAPNVAAPHMPVSATLAPPVQSTQGVSLQPSGPAKDVKASTPRLKTAQPDKPKLTSSRRHATSNHQAWRANLGGGSPHDVNHFFPSREWEENAWRDSRRDIAGRERNDRWQDDRWHD